MNLEENKAMSQHIAIPVFGELDSSATSTRTLDAIVDIDIYDQLYGVEILWLQDQLGGEVAKKLIQKLSDNAILFTYDDEVDILHFALQFNLFGVNNVRWEAVIYLNDATVNTFYIQTKCLEEYQPPRTP